MATTLSRIQLLTKVSGDWAATDPVLLSGEIGLADVGSSTPIVKAGDGSRPWSLLPRLNVPGVTANDYVAGDTTTLPPGSDATVTIDNTIDPPTISIGVPAGETGPPNSLAIGTVTTGPPGGAAAASITGTPPSQTLHLTIPSGQTGPQGPIGNTGPPNSLAIGTVTTGAPGSPAAASITGTPPNQTLNLTLPQGQQGPQGIQGIQGIQGPPGDIALADTTATIGLTRINGSSLLAMRSDAAPPLSQAIVPTWTGQHTFTALTSMQASLFFASTTPRIRYYETDAAVDNRMWDFVVATEQLRFRVADDADGTQVNWLTVDRTLNAIDAISMYGARLSIEHTLPRFRWLETDAATDEKVWDAVVSGGDWLLRTRTDADGGGVNAITITRTGTAIDSISFAATGAIGVSTSLTITGGTGQVLSLKAGPTADHVYMGFYPDTQNQATRWGYIGFPSVAGAHMALANEATGGNIQLGTTATGFVESLNDLRCRALGRFCGWYGTPQADPNGLATEVGVSGSTAYLLSYNRTTAAYGSLNLNGSQIDIAVGGAGTPAIRIDGTNKVLVSGIHQYSAAAISLQFNAGAFGTTYGSMFLSGVGPSGTWTGLGLDTTAKPVFMAGGSQFGIYSAQGAYWSIIDNGTSLTIGQKPMVSGKGAVAHWNSSVGVIAAMDVSSSAPSPLGVGHIWFEV